MKWGNREQPRMEFRPSEGVTRIPYFEVLLARLTYEKGERRPRDDFEGIGETQFTILRSA
jgi:hypothetical protein